MATILKVVNAKGFTLMELIIALAIIAVLATLALPSYQQQLQQSRRSDGTLALTTFAQRLERYFLEQGSYQGASTALYQTHSNQGFYQLTITADSRSYQIHATPVGAQADDTQCGTLSLNQLGARSISGDGKTTACW